MKILVIGASGQLGRELVTHFRQVHKQETSLIAVSRQELDVTQAAAVNRFIKENKPNWVINAAAYTAVDKAEQEVELAFAVNQHAVANLAAVCAEYSARLLHLSTDYVFDGSKDGAYSESDATKPINIYGKSKLAGEMAIAQHLSEHLILRVSWLFSAYGNNFVKTMIRLLQSKAELAVVDDQFGGPTPARAVAQTIDSCIQTLERGGGNWGTYHYSGTPVVNWHDFAQNIASILGNYKSLTCALIKPIASKDYPTAAKRPLNSCLDNSALFADFGIGVANWKQELANVIEQLAKSEEIA